jgi:sortase A
MLRGYQQVAIDEFVAGAGAFQGGIAETSTLVRDFEAFPPPQIDMDALANGEVFGLLTVPSWHEQTGISAELLRNRILVKQGGSTTAQSNRILNTGAAAHYTETAGPGEVGNFSLSAHRRSYGDNFLHLPALVEGDFVLLETAETWYIYRVIGEGFMVLPTETHVIDPDPFNPVLEDGTQRPTRRIMTLTTCTSANGGPWGNSHRWVVHLELDSWMPRSAGFPPMIDHYWTEEST